MLYNSMLILINFINWGPKMSKNRSKFRAKIFFGMGVLQKWQKHPYRNPFVFLAKNRPKMEISEKEGLVYNGGVGGPGYLW